jgi:hypothetical protein
VIPIAYFIKETFFPKPPPVEVASQVYDPHIDGFGWYLSGWNLKENADYKREIKDSVFYGSIKDLDGKKIRSVSIIQGYLPHGWQIEYKEGQGEDRLLVEGIPKKLIVKVKRGNYGFHLDPNETFAKRCWVTIGVDMRFSIKGKGYNASMNGNSLVIGVILFEVEKLYLYGRLIERIKPLDEVVLCTDLLKWNGEERLYHYSKVKAIINEEWNTYEINLYDVLFDSEKAFGIKIDKQHHIQPFIETCGGSIEAWIDYVAMG